MHFLHLVSKNLLNLHRQMHRVVSAIAAKSYTDNHQVGFDEYDGTVTPCKIRQSSLIFSLVIA